MGEDAEKFRESLKHGLQGRTICVQGKVGQKDGVAQIILKDRAQLSYPANKGNAENSGAYEDDGESDPDYDL
ncbi:hypothetical protein Q3407_10270 [Pseudomonas fulva]|nr:hypothetical protein Q3407_10270 [Pseudomonas fulva]